MAFKKNVTTIHGLNCSDAYHRVEGLNLLQKNQISFFVRIYADANKKAFSESIFYAPYELTGANPIAQAYEHLKTLPEFAGAIDC
jgi:hypothetical protein